MLQNLSTQIYLAEEDKYLCYSSPTKCWESQCVNYHLQIIKPFANLAKTTFKKLPMHLRKAKWINLPKSSNFLQSFAHNFCLEPICSKWFFFTFKDMFQRVLLSIREKCASPEPFQKVEIEISCLSCLLLFDVDM